MHAEDFAGQVAAAAEAMGAARPVIVSGPLAWSVRNAVTEALPDLLILGWHHRRLRRPWLAHPTAWRLSRSVPVDVLLVDLTGGALPQGDPRPGRPTPRD